MVLVKLLKKKSVSVARKSVSLSKTPMSVKNAKSGCASDSASDNEDEVREKACWYLLAKRLVDEFE